MSEFEVPEPILNSPFEEPAEHWILEEGRPAEKGRGRRPSEYFYRPPEGGGEGGPGTRIRLDLVNLVRERVKSWRENPGDPWPGVSRTTRELLEYWRREGREGRRLFFAQIEAAETIIFLIEARPDFRQGLDVPLDEPSEDGKRSGLAAFQRYACKMATGSGKTTVMAMLAAWSILNKLSDRANPRFSDTVFVVCPNVTIRSRLREIDPNEGEASVYRTRDLVPERLMPELRRGRVIVTNWHVFEPQTSQVGGASARVVKAGRPQVGDEVIQIGTKTTSARGLRYMTLEALDAHLASGSMRVLHEERDETGALKRVKVRSTKYVESDASVLKRILGPAEGKQNILVMNDEAHHAYRIRGDGGGGEEDDDDPDEFYREATVWVEGLDRIHRYRGINFCVDLSATPYFLGRAGEDTNRPFPWVVSDFGLTDGIESGLVKIPQLAVRDPSGADIPGYFNLWQWIYRNMTPAERGGARGAVKPEAVLKWAHTPIAMLGGLWDELRREWEQHAADPRPPVFIIVCKNTKIAKVIYDWIAEDSPPAGVPPARLPAFRNRDGAVNTIRVDTRVVHETDTGSAKSDESAWMRLTLDTVGRREWPQDRQGRPLHPEGFEELATKLGRPLHPPGRDVRCIVSVAMLTEGWDCNTVTHIIGLRPFMSQLLCEQVVGRGLRRRSYDVGPDDRLSEEVAKILGVPFEIVPFKANPRGAGTPRPKPHHVYALPERAALEIRFPRVEGYRQEIRNRLKVDWAAMPRLVLNPRHIPPEIEMKAALPANSGRPSLSGPGRIVNVTLNPYRQGRREQQLVFELARELTRGYAADTEGAAPTHVLFPQLVRIAERYLRDCVEPVPPAERLDVFMSPYYGWVIERLTGAIRPDEDGGEAAELPRYEGNRGPGTTAEVEFWTSRPVREVLRSHINYIVADTKVWEQSAAYFIDTHPRVVSFAKNAGLGLAIPYHHNGAPHDYLPDFIVRLKGDTELNLIVETKGFDPLQEVKVQAAQRWADAVNADGQFGRWSFALVQKPEEVRALLDRA